MQNEIRQKNISSELVNESIDQLNRRLSINLDTNDHVMSKEIVSENNKFKTIAFIKNNTIYSASFKEKTDEFIGITADEEIRDDESSLILEADNDRIETQAAVPLEECNEMESCTGCHYRIMKEVISQNGDSMIMCDKLGDRCDTLIIIAAAVHCYISH